jgi:hypothetical protein
MWYIYRMPRTNGTSHDLQRAALSTFAASLIFWAFFQISKRWGFAAANPFADDPVDAIGSIAVQVALAVSVLTVARAASVSRVSTAPTYKTWLIVRGNSVALLAIAVTLSADIFMELQHPTWNESTWGMLLIVGLGTVALLTCAAALIAVSAARRLNAQQISKRQPSEPSGSLGESLDDLWALARAILAWFSRRVPWLSRPLCWIDNVGNRLFEWLMNWPLIGPRVHPWRFCASVGLVIGVALAVVHGLEEGPPTNLALAMVVSSIFIGTEFVAVFVGYLALGGYLGLRPPLRLCRR